MNPAYSVILLTTLIGAGQGLFLVLFGAHLAGVAVPTSQVSPMATAAAPSSCRPAAWRCC